MYEYNFEHLILPKEEYKRLKKLYKKPLNADACKNLIHLQLAMYSNYKSDKIGNQIPASDKCLITEKGKCYIQYRKSQYISARIPIIISTVSLIISIVNIIIQIIKII
ncbi:MAG: hypothetical protein K2L10_04390 [Ruminococcus sp.]|nr:hypothetical protein [Ruminococcus sp.]